MSPQKNGLKKGRSLAEKLPGMNKMVAKELPVWSLVIFFFLFCLTSWSLNWTNFLKIYFSAPRCPDDIEIRITVDTWNSLNRQEMPWSATAPRYFACLYINCQLSFAIPLALVLFCKGQKASSVALDQINSLVPYSTSLSEKQTKSNYRPQYWRKLLWFYFMITI